MSKCTICSTELGEFPMCFGTASPASIMVSKSEYSNRVLENDDQCIVDNEYYFVRGHIEIPIIDSNEVFIWSVWVSLSKQSFENMSELWDTEGREKSKPYFGWLMTSLPCYTETQHLKTSVQSQPIGYVPLVTLEPTEHELAKEQHNGITMERVHEIVHQVMGH